MIRPSSDVTSRSRFFQQRWRLTQSACSAIQEAKTASSLNHPNIITIYEIGDCDSTKFIATEVVHGETLRQRMASSKLSLRKALDISVQIASALVEAHKAGVVHRDIKPENVMIRDDGIVKVLDFGLGESGPLVTIVTAL